MFDSILIANRGEIAVRIARTAHDMGLRVIAVYSEADANALHVRVADEAVCIGPAAATQSYLDQDAILKAARQSGAQCLHPGYGFLAENAAFAQKCADAGIVFVGPKPDAMRAMGLKSTAKTIMQKAGVPVVPGYHGDNQDDAELGQAAIETGFPVIIKPSAGGGGKGMRLVRGIGEFGEELGAARREAMASFGDDRVLIEKFIENPRHIEIQILADNHGNVVHLFERDCSAQRRHQKVIEETPAPGMTPQAREAMVAAAITAARAVNYSGAGTVEFIVDGTRELAADSFWFLEMNTRLQVEHPVSEMITGLDLVEWQLRVAAGETLPSRLSSLKINGHAIEARLYAEDPARGFLPCIGEIIRLDFGDVAENMRVDSGIGESGEVTPYYDPMVAKLIAWGKNRAQAIANLDRLIAGSVVAGVKTNSLFLRNLITHDEFAGGQIDTGFIERNLSELVAIDEDLKNSLTRQGVFSALFLHDMPADESPWSAGDGWQLGGERRIGLDFRLDGELMHAAARWRGGQCEIMLPGESDFKPVETDASFTLVEDKDGVYVAGGGACLHVAPGIHDAGFDAAGAGEGGITAPMPGRILQMELEEGQELASGETLLILEAMKMEHAIKAPSNVIITSIMVSVDDQVEEGAVLLHLERREE